MAADPPAIAENEIHLWRAPLDIAPEKLAAMETLLQPDEHARAGRFRFPQHKARFTAARGILRSILGLYAGCAPASLRFAYGEHGKPCLAEPAGTGIEFNVFHSGDMALYAVARGRGVGVDVERIKPEGSWLQIAKQYFPASEAEELAALPEEAMRQRFFELWAAKEARLKALGVGLRFPFENGGDAAAYSVINFSPMSGYAAALGFAPGGGEPLIVRHHFAA